MNKMCLEVFELKSTVEICWTSKLENLYWHKSLILIGIRIKKTSFLNFVFPFRVCNPELQKIVHESQ